MDRIIETKIVERASYFFTISFAVIKSNHRSVTTISAIRCVSASKITRALVITIDRLSIFNKKKSQSIWTKKYSSPIKQLQSTQIGWVRLIIFRFISLPMFFRVLLFRCSILVRWLHKFSNVYIRHIRSSVIPNISNHLTEKTRREMTLFNPIYP